MQDRLGKSDADVEVIALGSGTGVRLFRPTGALEPTPALVWIHGGGYVIGNAEQYDRICSKFSRRLGVTVASVDTAWRQNIRIPFRSKTAMRR